MIGLFHESRLLSVACLTGPDAAFGAGRYWHWRLRMLLTAGLFGTKQMLEKEEKVRNLVPNNPAVSSIRDRQCQYLPAPKATSGSVKQANASNLFS